MSTEHYKLASLDPRNACFRQGRESFASEAEARAAAKHAGTYRVSRVTDSGTTDLEPFVVEESVDVLRGVRGRRGGVSRQPLNTRVARRAPGT